MTHDLGHEDATSGTATRCHTSSAWNSSCQSPNEAPPMNLENRMSARRLLLALALSLLAVRCTNEHGASPTGIRLTADQVVADSTQHTLQQDASAPALETYHVSFWARKGKASTVAVNYLPAGGPQFLQFDLTKESVISGAGGQPIGKADSVLVTLDIDTLNLQVSFQPEGMKFSLKSPPTLTICYGNANPDLNGDGVVDATDTALQQQVAIWFESSKGPSVKLISKNDTAGKCVSARLYHFSQYAVSW